MVFGMKCYLVKTNDARRFFYALVHDAKTGQFRILNATCNWIEDSPELKTEKEAIDYLNTRFEVLEQIDIVQNIYLVKG